MSRWAYPAGQALADLSKHGSMESTCEAHEIIQQERQEEQEAVLRAACSFTTAQDTDEEQKAAEQIASSCLGEQAVREAPGGAQGA